MAGPGLRVADREFERRLGRRNRGLGGGIGGGVAPPPMWSIRRLGRGDRGRGGGMGGGGGAPPGGADRRRRRGERGRGGGVGRGGGAAPGGRGPREGRGGAELEGASRPLRCGRSGAADPVSRFGTRWGGLGEERRSLPPSTNNPVPRKLKPDLWLIAVVVLLLSVGVVMVYSASAIVAADRFHDPYLFLKKQLFWALLGSTCLVAALRLDYHRLERLGWPILAVAGLLLVLVLVPPLAQPINGTRRWLRLGSVSFQPVELAKLALVIYLAAWLARKRDEIGDFWRGFLPPLAVSATLAALVLAQPDLGNCLTLIAVTFALLYLAGSHSRHLGLVIGAALPFLALAVWLAPYRVRRITTFLDPWSDPRGGGLPIIPSWLAFGGGGALRGGGR